MGFCSVVICSVALLLVRAEEVTGSNANVTLRLRVSPHLRYPTCTRFTILALHLLQKAVSLGVPVACPMALCSAACLDPRVLAASSLGSLRCLGRERGQEGHLGELRPLPDHLAHRRRRKREPRVQGDRLAHVLPFQV